MTNYDKIFLKSLRGKSLRKKEIKFILKSLPETEELINDFIVLSEMVKDFEDKYIEWKVNHIAWKKKNSRLFN